MFNNYGFIFLGLGTDPYKDREVIEQAGFKTTLVPAPEPEMAVKIASELEREGAQLIELCGAFGPVITAKVIEATGSRIPIGSVSYGSESVDALSELTRQ